MYMWTGFLYGIRLQEAYQSGLASLYASFEIIQIHAFYTDLWHDDVPRQFCAYIQFLKRDHTCQSIPENDCCWLQTFRQSVDRFVKSQVRTIASTTLNVVSELDRSRNTSLYRQATLTCAGACTTRRPGKALQMEQANMMRYASPWHVCFDSKIITYSKNTWKDS